MNQIQTKTTRIEWITFFAVAYCLTFVMGIPLGLCQRAGYPTDIFPNAQMFYPAAGAILACLIAGKSGALPKRFYCFYLAVAALLVAMCVVSCFVHSVDWTMTCNYVIIITSAIAWILLLTEKKAKRENCGLRWHGGFAKPFGAMLLFVLLKVVSVAVSVILSGSTAEYLAYLGTATPWVVLVALIPNFFLSFLPFFGEEYGWRYWLQPRLQQRFGARRGVLLLGVLWGLWHLPLNLFYYSPETSLQSIAAQIITCVSLGVFFAFAYLKTNNIWVPVILHYLNNNLIVVFSGTAIISNQVYAWTDILLVFVLDAVLYLPFLLSKVFAKQPESDLPEAPAAQGDTQPQ